MGKENRLLQRTRKRYRVTLGNTPAFTSDISPGGLCIETMTPQNPGTDVTGQLFIDRETFDFTGRVCWAITGDLRANQRGRMGVRLTGIPSGYYKLFM